MVDVSIIIPYYNSEKTIIRALNSVINQTYKKFEIILINDGSNDKSYQLVENFIKKNSCYKFIHLTQKNMGPSKARNEGAKVASGEIIAFLDSDDEWTKDKLEIQLRVLKKNNIVLLGCNYFINKDNKKQKFYFIKTKFRWITFYRLLFKHYFKPSCTIMKKSVFLELGGFPEEQNYMEDSLLFFRVARKNKVGIIGNFLVIDYKAPYGEAGLSSNLKKMEYYELKNLSILRKENNKNALKLNFALYCISMLFSVAKYIYRITKSVMLKNNI